jgi:prolyl 4-hydroxylase
MERQSILTSKRLFVFMLYLNTVNDKGGTEFKYYNHIEKAEAGKLLIWPPDFTHTHRGVVSPTEKKYIITGWYSLIPA